MIVWVEFCRVKNIYDIGKKIFDCGKKGSCVIRACKVNVNLPYNNRVPFYDILIIEWAEFRKTYVNSLLQKKKQMTRFAVFFSW